MRPIKTTTHSKAKKPTAPPADLLVCFPARRRLPLLPKPASSPARAPADTRRRHQPPAQASPLPWGAREMAPEPTSPKVTCAGQIKIRPHAAKNWQSVMEEIERIHNNKKKIKTPISGNRNQNQNRTRNPNFRREIVSFLSCLRGLRFDFPCFRGFPDPDTETESESESDPDPEAESESMFSKWFMVLHEDEDEDETNPGNVAVSAPAPPSNALLLMRCRSAPSIGRLERNPKAEDDGESWNEKNSKLSLKLLMAEEEAANQKKENLVVMDYDADFYRLSSDIAKETWVVSGSSKSCNDDPLVRSRSWKR